jgi:hypothetical protein
MERNVVLWFLGLCVAFGAAGLLLSDGSSERWRSACESKCVETGQSYVYVPSGTAGRYMRYWDAGSCQCLKTEPGKR